MYITLIINNKNISSINNNIKGDVNESLLIKINKNTNTNNTNNTNNTKLTLVVSSIILILLCVLFFYLGNKKAVLILLISFILIIVSIFIINRNTEYFDFGDNSNNSNNSIVIINSTLYDIEYKPSNNKFNVILTSRGNTIINNENIKDIITNLNNNGYTCYLENNTLGIIIEKIDSKSIILRYMCENCDLDNKTTLFLYNNTNKDLTYFYNTNINISNGTNNNINISNIGNTGNTGDIIIPVNTISTLTAFINTNINLKILQKAISSTLKSKEGKLLFSNNLYFEDFKNKELIKDNTPGIFISSYNYEDKIIYYKKININ
jgi:hypothetical protein